MSRFRQRGVSLVSLMVGLVLGLLSTVAGMALFRVVAQNAISAQANAAQDNVISSALLAAQMEIQKAGYGIQAATGNCAGSAVAAPSAAINQDFVMYSGASQGESGISGELVTIDGSSRDGNAVFWHWKEGTVEYCGGLLSTANHVRLLRKSNCTTLAGITAVAWDSVSELIPESRVKSGTPAITFSAQRANCWPFGKHAVAAGLQVGMTAAYSAGLSARNAVCLPNICQ